MGGGCPPGGSEEVADLHGLGGGVVFFEDRPGDLVGGLALQDALDSQLGCPLVVTLQGVGTTADHVAVPQDQIHLSQDGVHVGGDLPALVDLHGVGEGVGHGVGVVDLFSIEPRWGAGVPPCASSAIGFDLALHVPKILDQQAGALDAHGWALAL